MTKLYDKNGKPYNVPHAVDVKDWISSGDYFKENPIKKPKGAEKQKNLLSDKDK